MDSMNMNNQSPDDYDDETPSLFSLLEILGLFALLLMIITIITLLGMWFLNFLFDFEVFQILKQNQSKLFTLCFYMAFCLATLFMVLLVKWRIDTLESWESVSSYLGFLEPNWTVLLKWTAIIIGFRLLSWGGELSGDQIGLKDDLFVYGIWFSLLSTVIIAPIFEEIFFRGILWRATYDKSQSFHVAFWVSGVFFALAHLNFSPFALFHHLLFSYVVTHARLHGGTLAFSIFLHFLHNFLLFLDTLFIMSKDLTI